MISRYKINTYYSLFQYNTFNINVKSKFFASINSIPSLLEVLSDEKLEKEPKLILGGGSNILFTKDFEGLTIKNNIKGIKVVDENENHAFIEVGGGENWHEFVLFCVKNGYQGVENLSLIPGSVGAAPIQNIGAYGVELKDIFISLKAIVIGTGDYIEFTNEECEFGYRDSIFKNAYKGKLFITSVVFRLNKKYNFNTSYGAIEKELDKMGVTGGVSIKAISDAVINIRKSKLPNPKEIGNAGSFFKNPMISNNKFKKIKEEFPEIAYYKVNEEYTKIAAGWLIDKAGWKGKTINNYGVHKNQALVLVNYGGASGKDIYNLSSEIKDSIEQKFGIILEREVNII